MNLIRPSEEVHLQHHQQHYNQQSEQHFKIAGPRGPQPHPHANVQSRQDHLPHQQHHQATPSQVHQNDHLEGPQNLPSQVVLRPKKQPKHSETAQQPEVDVEVQPQSRLSLIENRVSFRPFYTLLKKEKAPSPEKPTEKPSEKPSKTLPEKYSENLPGKPEEELSERLFEHKNDESSVEDSSSEETEPTEYLTLATSGSTHEEETKSSSSSPGFGLELVSNIEDNSKLFTLLRIIKDSKLEGVKREDSSSGDDKEVEQLTRNKVEEQVEEPEAGTLEAEKTEESANIFTMTELSEDKGQDLYQVLDNLMDGSVDGLGDIMHMFELIEGDEKNTPTSANFEPLDQFEYIEVTSHADGGLKSQRGKTGKSSFSSDLHIIVLSDEEENGQSIGSMDSQKEQNSTNPNEGKSEKSAHATNSEEEGGILSSDPEEREIQIRNSPTFVSFVEYI